MYFAVNCTSPFRIKRRAMKKIRNKGVKGTFKKLKIPSIIREIKLISSVGWAVIKKNKGITAPTPTLAKRPLKKPRVVIKTTLFLYFLNPADRRRIVLLRSEE